MDRIIIQELKVETIIGCLNWERQVKQPVILDLEIEYDLKSAGKTDDLTHTLDYQTIANTITSFLEPAKFKLIEALAEQTAALIVETFHLQKVSLKVTKPAAIGNGTAASVCITRP